MKDRGELEVGHMWDRFIGCGMFKVESIETEKDDEDPYSSIENKHSRS